MAKKISKGSIQRSKDKPTTGDGRSMRQKPKLSETNLQGSDQQSWFPSIFTRRSKPGKHS